MNKIIVHLIGLFFLIGLNLLLFPLTKASVLIVLLTPIMLPLSNKIYKISTK